MIPVWLRVDDSSSDLPRDSRFVRSIANLNAHTTCVLRGQSGNALALCVADGRQLRFLPPGTSREMSMPPKVNVGVKIQVMAFPIQATSSMQHDLWCAVWVRRRRKRPECEGPRLECCAEDQWRIGRTMAKARRANRHSLTHSQSCQSVA